MKTLLTITLTLLLSTLSFAASPQVDDLQATESEFTDNLIDAVSNLDLVSLNVLLSEGASVDTVDQDGNTPLMVAAKIGNPRIVRILLAHNPDLNKKNSAGNTALMIASEHGQTFVVEQLLAKGADENAKNAMGFTSLEIAKRNGHAAIVDILKHKTEASLSR
ncbi:ankyrin repeat domain-containing protein [Rhodohalobacter sp. 614A]|uniref:ankyrin repeat domain-containing protein n=1 Tax=Rhodohalobacter sp. 614A TaxID=2908649 RepID=UPI001F221719|nr:ankyrin repeat domain-containing protein [Rhodohalobacter sp. 614A]